MGFRDLSGNANVTCSPNSNATSGAANTWAPRFPLAGGSDFPRVAVGSDGSFYVVYITRNSMGTPDTIWIDKFMPCTTEPPVMNRVVATPAFPRMVSALSNFAGCQVAGGFAGLDRCNNGNILSGPTVAVDDTNFWWRIRSMAA
jgi:hypothetical protein